MERSSAKVELVVVLEISGLVSEEPVGLREGVAAGPAHCSCKLEALDLRIPRKLKDLVVLVGLPVAAHRVTGWLSSQAPFFCCEGPFLMAVKFVELRVLERHLSEAGVEVPALSWYCLPLAWLVSPWCCGWGR